MVTTLRLVREIGTIPTGRPILHEGGTLTFRAYEGNRWVGWVGDGREWQGANYGRRRWWCACRQDGGDEIPRWGTGIKFATRASAVDALSEAIGDHDDQR